MWGATRSFARHIQCQDRHYPFGEMKAKWLKTSLKSCKTARPMEATVPNRPFQYFDVCRFWYSTILLIPRTFPGVVRRPFCMQFKYILVTLPHDVLSLTNTTSHSLLFSLLPWYIRTTWVWGTGRVCDVRRIVFSAKSATWSRHGANITLSWRPRCNQYKLSVFCFLL